MSDKKIYVGNGTEKFNGDLVEFSVNLSRITKEASEHIFEYNGEKFIKLVVAKKQGGADDYGKTHYVKVDTFKPQAQAEPTVVEEEDNDLPF